MSTPYSPREIEKKWQDDWEKSGLFHVADDAPDPRYYCLMMFPYPSAALHVGHGRNYIIGDVVARYKLMRGFHVLTPMGWASFGLPAENAAIKGGLHPRESALGNIATMKRQLRDWGVCNDWDREVTSCDPGYYRWTQWLFLKLYAQGLAYRKSAAVNWCPSCATVLANEQVVDGECERCGAPVRQKELEQWFFRITAFAQRLLDDLALLPNWPERVKTMQKNWIGRSEGCEIDFRLASTGETVTCFTTRLDTIYGATYMVVAPEHPIVKRLDARDSRAAEIKRFADRVAGQDRITRAADDTEKEGIFTGEEVVNPFTGEKIPLWVANYVLMEYGTGAVMAVPAHDQRDFEFAKKYGLPVTVVIQDEGRTLDAGRMTGAYEGDGALVNSAQFDGLPNREAIAAMADFMERGGFGRRAVCYRLRDWLISRQRYWGPPIPVIYCDGCGTVPVPEQDLPVILPALDDFRPDDSGISPLARAESWYRVPCPKCGKPGRRETDVSDTFLDSAWYFLRYPSANRNDVAFDPELTRKWLPVASYIGGNEHAVLHLMYARFVTMALHDIGLVPFEEPFRRFRAHGTIVKDGAKMSKSRGNVVNPDTYVERWGADTFRMYLMFLGPYQEGGDFRDAGISGIRRFLDKVWILVAEAAGTGAQTHGRTGEAAPVAELVRMMHRTIQRVTDDTESLSYNTAIAAMMEYVNALRDGVATRALLEPLALLLAPYAPHFAEECWERLGRTTSVMDASWPSFDPSLAVAEEVEFVVQVNGKVRARLRMPRGAAQDIVVKAALADPGAIKFIGGNQPKKVVFVRDRLVNIVV